MPQGFPWTHPEAAKVNCLNLVWVSVCLSHVLWDFTRVTGAWRHCDIPPFAIWFRQWAKNTVASHEIPCHNQITKTGSKGASKTPRASRLSYRHPFSKKASACASSTSPRWRVTGRDPEKGPKTWERGRRIGQWQRPDPPFLFRAGGRTAVRQAKGGAEVQRH